MKAGKNLSRLRDLAATLTLQSLLVMFILLSLIALALLKLQTSLLSFTTELSATFQNKCVLLSPKNFTNTEWIAAVVCGKNPARNSEYQLLQLSGLLHLIVVSGSHLVFVEQILSIVFRFLKVGFFFKVAALTMFALMTGFQAPVLRALIFQLLNHLQCSWKLFWNPPAVTLFAGVIALIIAPDWWTSVSLQLSWVAALSLQAYSSRSLVRQQITIFILMMPVLMQLAPPHPVTIVYNLLMAPIIGLFLFPISALAMAFPKLLWFVDDLWSYLFKFLEFSLPISSLADPIQLGSPLILWIYIIGLNIFIINRRHRQCRSY